MFDYLPLQWLFLFYLYSFLGWCFESAYVSILNKRLVNRGFMRGPFLPLYGSGGIMMLVVSKPFYSNIVLVYIAGCIGATALEYVVGVLMELLFKVRYWDYSNKFLNINGHVCLESTLVWGFFTVLFTHYLQIPVEMFITSIPYNFLSIFTTVLTVYVSCDFMIAFKTALDIRDFLTYMEKAKEEMGRIQKRLDVIIAFKGEDVRESIDKKVDGISSGIGSRVDVLSNALEKSFASLKEKVSREPSPYLSGAKEEIAEMYTKYRILMDRLTPGPIRGFFDWYRNRTIIGNPGMVSEKFKTSLEEIKEKASNIRKNH